jgi:hypothetical protein
VKNEIAAMGSFRMGGYFVTDLVSPISSGRLPRRAPGRKALAIPVGEQLNLLS